MGQKGFLKIILLFFIAGISLTSYGQHYNAIVSDSEIVLFMKWKMQSEPRYHEDRNKGPKKLFSEISRWDTVTFFPSRRKNNKEGRPQDYLFPARSTWKWIDTIFSNDDREYLYQQFLNQQGNQWMPVTKNTRLVTKTKKNKTNNLYFLSLPLFSLDKKYVIQKEYFYCGKLCAYSSFRIYRKVSATEWEYVGRANLYTS